MENNWDGSGPCLQLVSIVSDLVDPMEVKIAELETRMGKIELISMDKSKRLEQLRRLLEEVNPRLARALEATKGEL